MEGPAESVSSGRMETLLSLIGGGFEGLLGGVMMVMMMVIMVIMLVVMLVVMLVTVCGSGVDGQHMKCAFGC